MVFSFLYLGVIQIQHASNRPEAVQYSEIESSQACHSKRTLPVAAFAEKASGYCYQGTSSDFTIEREFLGSRGLLTFYVNSPTLNLAWLHLRRGGGEGVGQLFEFFIVLHQITSTLHSPPIYHLIYPWNKSYLCLQLFKRLHHTCSCTTVQVV